MVCNKCGTENKEGSKFCSKCGSLLVSENTIKKERICPACGSKVDGEDDFCSVCGSNLNGAKVVVNSTLPTSTEKDNSSVNSYYDRNTQFDANYSKENGEKKFTSNAYGFCICSLITGILSIFFSLANHDGNQFYYSIIGIVFGLMGISSVCLSKKSHGALRNAGLVTSVIGFVLCVYFLLISFIR